MHTNELRFKTRAYVASSVYSIMVEACMHDKLMIKRAMKKDLEGESKSLKSFLES
jgi:hypothetical protein